MIETEMKGNLAFCFASKPNMFYFVSIYKAIFQRNNNQIVMSRLLCDAIDIHDREISIL